MKIITTNIIGTTANTHQPRHSARDDNVYEERENTLVTKIQYAASKIPYAVARGTTARGLFLLATYIPNKNIVGYPRKCSTNSAMHNRHGCRA